MPFLIVQRYNGSQSALTRSSPADGEKNLHRRIFLFKLILPFSIFVRSYSSLPTLQSRAAVREYRHDKNTAYSGSLDASDKTNIQSSNRINNLLLYFSIRAIVLSKYRPFGLSIYRTIELSICRTLECSRVTCFNIR